MKAPNDEPAAGTGTPATGAATGEDTMTGPAAALARFCEYPIFCLRQPVAKRRIGDRHLELCDVHLRRASSL